MTGYLAQLFNIETSERRPLFLLSGYAFLLSAGYVLFNTAAYALFLSDFGITALPYTYVAVALVGPATGWLYTRLENKLPHTKLIAATLGATLILTISILVLSKVSGARSASFVLLVWCDVVFTITALGYWEIASRLFDLRQGKRLFGLITAAELAGGTCAGLLIPLILKAFATSSLLWIGTAPLLPCLLIVLFMAGQLPEDDSPTSHESTESDHKETHTPFWSRKYVQLIIIFNAVWIMAFYVLDYAFYQQAEIHYIDEQQLASFLGLFNGVSQGVRLLATTVLSGTLISRWGLKAGLVLPTSIMTVAVIFLVFTSGGSFGALFFWILISVKLGDGVLSSSLLTPASKLLYQPLAPHLRNKLQAFVDTILSPIGGGIAGLVLLVIARIDRPGLVVGSMLGLWLVWTFVSFILRREYTQALMSALTNRSLSGNDLDLIDACSLDIVRSRLSSQRPGEVLYALSLLERQHDESLPGHLEDALRHPDDDVRAEALSTIARLRLTESSPAVKELITGDSSARVKASAIRTYCNLGEYDDIEEVAPYLDDPDSDVSIGAMDGLLHSGGIEGILVAGHRVIEMQDSPDSEVRRKAADLLGRIAVRGFYRPVLKLLSDDDLAVRQAALRATGTIRHHRLWPTVAAHLTDPRCQREATRALIKGGNDVISVLAEVFDQPTTRLDIRLRILRICARIGGADSTTFLEKHIDEAESDLRYRVLASLDRVGWRPQPGDVERIRSSTDSEIAWATRLYQAGAGLEHEDSELVDSALLLELDYSLERALLQLSFLYNPEVIRRAQSHLRDPSNERQAYAVELLDSVLPTETKTTLLPLLERSAARDTDYKRDLLELMSMAIKPWTRVCVLASITERSDEFEQAAVDGLNDPEPVVREASINALRRLAPDILDQHSESIAGDQSALIQLLIKRMDSDEENQAMRLSIIERVLFLRGVTIFARIPDDVLAGVAEVATETFSEQGANVFEKGDPPDHLYFIVKGKIRLLDGERVVTRFGEGELAGEIALLQGEPQAFSAVADEDTLMLVLGQERFWDLMHDYSSLNRGIIKVLCQRLQEMSTVR